MTRPDPAALEAAKARYDATARDINGDWEIALRSEQLAALLAGFGLPEIAASGSGKFGVKPAAGAASASGTLEAGVTGLGKLSPALAAVGAVRVKSAFDGAVADNAAEIRAFSVELADGAGRKFGELALLQKAVYRLTDRRVTLPDPRADAARLTLDAVPLAWAQPVLAPMRVEGGTLSVRLAIEGEPDGSRVKLRSIAPLTLAGITVSDARNQKLLDRVTLSVAPSVDYTPARLSARLADLSLAMTTGDSLSGEIAADVANPGAKPSTEFRARLQAKLVSLAKPFLAFDPGVLATLPEREYRAGLFEVVKYGIISSPKLFALLADHSADVLAQKPEAVDFIVDDSVRIKAEVVTADDKESDLRRILNYGHTLGHALEAETNYSRFLHGEAVAYGMNAAAFLAERLSILPKADADEIRRVTNLYGPIPALDGLSGEALAGHILKDKKTIQGKTHFVLAESIGRVRVVGGIAGADVVAAAAAALQ